MTETLKLTKFVFEDQDGREISLSPVDARKLFDQLKELFGERDVFHYYFQPQAPAPQPWIAQPWIAPSPYTT